MDCPPGEQDLDSGQGEDYVTTGVDLLVPLDNTNRFSYDITGSGPRNALGIALSRQLSLSTDFANRVLQENQAATQSRYSNLLIRVLRRGWPPGCGLVTLRTGASLNPGEAPTPAVGGEAIRLVGPVGDTKIDLAHRSHLLAEETRPLLLFGLLAGTTIPLPLYGAHIAMTRSPDGAHIQGQIHGVLKESDLDAVVLARIADTFTRIMTEWDENANSIVGQLKRLFCKENKPCTTISADQVKDAGMLVADVDAFDGDRWHPRAHGVTDAISFGFGFTAERRTDVRPQTCPLPHLCVDTTFPLFNGQGSCNPDFLDDRVWALRGLDRFDVWALSERYPGPGPFHFDGLRWGEVPLPQALLWAARLRRVWPVGPQDAYFISDSDLWRRRHGVWELQARFPDYTLRDLLVDPGEQWSVLGLARQDGAGPWEPRLFSTAPGLAFAQAERPSEQLINHADFELPVRLHKGGGRRFVISPTGTSTSTSIGTWTKVAQLLGPMGGLVALGEDEAWAAADQSGGKVLHFKDGVWEARAGALATQGVVKDLWATGPDDVWVAGESLSHWDGQRWTQLPFSTATARRRYYILSGFSASPRDVFLGTRCGILRYQP